MRTTSLDRFIALRATLPEDPPDGLKSTRPDPEERAREWVTKCPDEYRATDRKRLVKDTGIAKETITEVGEFPILEQSLLLRGPQQRGKTRLAWMLLEKHFMAGRRVLGMDSMQFNSDASAAYREGEESRFFAKMLRPDILFIDDLGKAKATERTLEALFTVLERRGAARKTMLSTINGTIEDLENKWIIKASQDPELVAAITERIKRWTGQLSIKAGT